MPMITCPNSEHEDKCPSAVLNLETKVWFCMACQTGGSADDEMINKYTRRNNKPVNRGVLSQEEINRQIKEATMRYRLAGVRSGIRWRKKMGFD